MKKLTYAIVGMAALMGCFGWLFAQSLAKQRDFDGTVSVKIGLKEANGTWNVIDTLNAPGTHITTSVAELAGTKKVSTPFVFNGKSQQGRQISVRLQNAGDATVSLDSGQLDTKLPVQLSVDGKTFNFLLPLSTESSASPIGPLSGRRAVIDKATRTATLKLAGASQLTLPGVRIASPGAIIQKKESEGPAEGRLLANEPLVLSVEMDGKLTAR